MQKRFTRTLCLILVLGSLLCLCACTSSGSVSTPTTTEPLKQYVTGRYEIQKIQWADGTEASGQQLQDLIAVVGETFLELYSDHTALLCLLGQRFDMEFSDTQMWSVTNKLITYEIFVQNGTVTLDYCGTIYTFVKM